MMFPLGISSKLPSIFLLVEVLEYYVDCMLSQHTRRFSLVTNKFLIWSNAPLPSLTREEKELYASHKVPKVYSVGIF
jgi:hypothetical protein